LLKGVIGMAPIDQPASVSSRAGANTNMVTIIGEAGAGKSLLSTNLASHLAGHGQRVVHVSCGHIFRALGVLAVALTGPRYTPQPGRILAVAAEQFSLVDGWPYIDGQRLSEAALRLKTVEDWSSRLGGVDAAHQYMVEQLSALRDRMASQNGFVVADGRGLHQDFPGSCTVTLRVSLEVAARRTRRPAAELRRRNDRDSSHGHGLPGDLAVLQTVDVDIDTDPYTPTQVLEVALPRILHVLRLKYSSDRRLLLRSDSPPEG
jgi:cytidylate kinase